MAGTQRVSSVPWLGADHCHQHEDRHCKEVEGKGSLLHSQRCCWEGGCIGGRGHWQEEPPPGPGVSPPSEQASEPQRGWGTAHSHSATRHALQEGSRG